MSAGQAAEQTEEPAMLNSSAQAVNLPVNYTPAEGQRAMLKKKVAD